MDDVLKLFFPAYSSLRSRSMALFPVNIYDDVDAYYLEAAFPGFTKESIGIKAENGILTISAKKPEKDKRDYLLSEIESYNEYERSFKMTEGIDLEKVSAKFEGGMLTLTLAKAPSKKPKQISIA